MPDITLLQKELIGKTVKEAQQIHPFIRAVTVNGKSMVVTMDFQPDRVNVEIENDIIIGVKYFG